jgi:hypothetical protein
VVHNLRRAGFSSQPKVKVGSTLTKAADFRVNLNIDGAPITSRTHTHPSHSQTSRLLTSSLSLGVPVPRSNSWDIFLGTDTRVDIKNMNCFGGSLDLYTREESRADYMVITQFPSSEAILKVSFCITQESTIVWGWCVQARLCWPRDRERDRATERALK